MQHHEIMADDAWLVLDANTLAFRSEELPRAAVELSAIVERRVPAQIRWSGERLGATEIPRGRDQELVHLAKRAHHESVLTGRLGAHPQRHIEALGEHVHAAITHAQLEADRRIALEKCRQDRCER